MDALEAESSEEAFEEASISEAELLEEIFATSTTPGAEDKNEVLDDLLQVPSGMASVADIHAATDSFFLDEILKETESKTAAKKHMVYLSKPLKSLIAMNSHGQIYIGGDTLWTAE